MITRKKIKTISQTLFIIVLLIACICCVIYRNTKRKIEDEKFKIPQTEQQAEAQELLGEITQEQINN